MQCNDGKAGFVYFGFVKRITDQNASIFVATTDKGLNQNISED